MINLTEVSMKHRTLVWYFIIIAAIGGIPQYGGSHAAPIAVRAGPDQHRLIGKRAIVVLRCSPHRVGRSHGQAAGHVWLTRSPRCLPRAH